MNRNNLNLSHHDTIIIGGGQAGLAMGYQLMIKNREFLILDESEKVGGRWDSRWDSLQLFTPGWAVKYPGHEFPKVAGTFPAKNDVVDFLASFSQKFRMPIRTNMRVTKVEQKTDYYEITAAGKKFTCHHFIVATGNYAKPKIPRFATELSPEIVQMHSSEYKNPSRLPDGEILVVGAGTSGLQIALDIARAGKSVRVSGNPPPQIPPLMLKYFRRQMIWMMNNRMTINTKAGRKMRDAIKLNGQAAPLLNISLKEVTGAGAIHVARVASTSLGYPLLEDESVCRVAAVIWCTGFTRDFSWLHNMKEIIDSHQYPITERGVVPSRKGLYFLGMAFQYAITSTWILGIGRDAEYIANHIHTNGHS